MDHSAPMVIDCHIPKLPQWGMGFYLASWHTLVHNTIRLVGQRGPFWSNRTPIILCKGFKLVLRQKHWFCLLCLPRRRWDNKRNEATMSVMCPFSKLFLVLCSPLSSEAFVALYNSPQIAYFKKSYNKCNYCSTEKAKSSVAANGRLEHPPGGNLGSVKMVGSDRCPVSNMGKTGLVSLTASPHWYKILLKCCYKD